MQRVVDRGIQVLIPPEDSSRRRGARPGWDGGLYAFMRRALETKHGTKLYGKRQQIIVPVFGHTKFNRGMDRFHPTRQSSRPHRMATDHRHPPLAQALATHHRTAA